MEEVTDEPLYRDRVCGIDIGKAGLVATIRVPSDRDPARRAAETRSFGTTKREVLALADWLRSWQVPAVVMEATRTTGRGRSTGWRPRGSSACWPTPNRSRTCPAGPSGTRLIRGGWRRAAGRGAVTACFAVTPEFRIIRLHTRYRRDLTEERTREKQRAEKLLESAAIKVSSVLTGLHGVTGRDIMDHLIAGERNPKVLAQLARAAARRKISQLEEAMEGAEFFTAGHAALLAKVLARIGRLSADIEDLSAVTGRLLAPYEEQLAPGRVDARLGTARRPGRHRRNRRGHDQVPHRRAPVLLGRPRPARPPVRQTQGTRQAKKGNRYLGAITGETAVAAGRTQTREGVRHRRLARRRGTAKACVATGNTQLKVYHKLLSSPGMRYQDLGPDYYERQRDVRRQVAHHIGKLGSLGFEVTLCRIPEPGPDRTAPAQSA